MALPAAALPMGAGIATLLGFGLVKAFHGPKVESNAAVQEMGRTFTVPGPRGEWVFRPEYAQTILQALAGMIYSYPGDDHSLVKVEAEPNGAPVTPDLSATQWVHLQNRTLSILAPVYMGAPTSSEKFLRAVPPGQEGNSAGPGSGYAVLLYAGTLDRNMTPPGMPSSQVAASAPLAPTPVSTAIKELPKKLVHGYNKILREGRHAPSIRKTAQDLKNAGLRASSALLNKKATDLELQNWLDGSPVSRAAQTLAPSIFARSQTPVLDTSHDVLPPHPMAELSPSLFRHPMESHAERAPGPVVATTRPAGWTMPVRTVQAQLILLGLLSATNDQGKRNDDGIRGKITDLTVRYFQKQHNLPVTGIVDAATADALKSARTAAEPAAPAETLVQALAKPSPVLNTTADVIPPRAAPTVSPHLFPQESHAELSPGPVVVTTRPAHWVLPVRTVQQRLIAMGLLSPRSDKGKPNDDGIRGHTTDITVRAFQSQHNLPVTGIVDKATAAALSQAPTMVSGADEEGPTSRPAGWAIDVRTAQKLLVRLNLLGFFEVNGTPDSMTQGAIAMFQGSRKLPRTGIVDSATAALLIQAAGVNAVSGTPFFGRQDVSLSRIYGPHPMDRYAAIWGRQDW
jgi:peptidoglycan hydrolase-like protein with peptidoglycan-binding domain